MSARNDAPERLLAERLRLGELLAGEAIGLGEDEDEVADLLRDGGDQLELVARDRRIAAEDHERSVDVRDEGACGRRVPLEHGADPGGIDQAEAGREERARHEDLDARHVLLVLGVLRLRDERGELGDGHGPPWLVRGPHTRLQRAAVTKDRDDGRDRRHSHGKNRRAYERVQERRLATLELTEARDEEAALVDTLRGGARLGRSVGGPEVAGDALERLERHGSLRSGGGGSDSR